MTLAIASGKLPTELAQRTSDLIHELLERGMEVDEACCIVVAVAADYARGEYGSAYLQDLAEIVTKRADLPMPEPESVK